MSACGFCGLSGTHRTACLGGAAAAGAERRNAGLARVEARRDGWVQRARAVAVELARRNGQVHVDDIRDWAARTGDPAPSSRAWGAVFGKQRGLRWVAVGVRASRHASNHAHASPVWTLTEAVET